MNTWKNQSIEIHLKDSEKDPTAIRNDCRSLDHLAIFDNFAILRNLINNYYLSQKTIFSVLNWNHR